MIIGSGSIARCLQDRENAIFFASGVSNSVANDKNEFEREMSLLYEFEGFPYSCFFYFSSIGIETGKKPLSAYFEHKLRMEEEIKKIFYNYVILRIGNLIGDTNPNTFVNYLRAHPEAEIKDEYRYMISPEMLNTLCQTLPLDQKIELTVATKIGKVKDLI